jgi:hypothetical protein
MKMATGTGKTVVMAMLIAWHALNKIADPKDRRFSDTFLVATPGITIRDRLRVLWPHDAENYYRLRDLVPPDLIGQLGRANILITNFHAFKIRKLIETNKLTKEILGSAIRIDTLDDLKDLRLNEVAFRLAKLTLEKYFRDDGGHDKPWLFPQLLAITKR